MTATGAICTRKVLCRKAESLPHCDAIIAVEAKVSNFQPKLCTMNTNRLSQAVRIEVGRQISLPIQAEVD